MAGHTQKRIGKNLPFETAQPESLESKLASVVEQDDVILNTPQGVRRRKKATKVPPAAMPQPVFTAAVEKDAIEALDRAVVSVHVGKGGGIPQNVEIHFGEHVRSPFVVSLQKLLLSSASTEVEERQHVSAPFARPHAFSVESRPVEAYAAVGADLSAENDPRAFVDQFTASTFEDAYRAVYGRFDRFSVAVREVGSILAGIFQRIERVETEAVEDVKEAIGVVEVARFSFVRALAAFAGLALVVTLPANAIALYRSVSTQKQVAANAGSQAVETLLAAKDAGSIPDSANALRKASGQFRAVDAMLGEANALAIGIASVLPKQYRSARALVEVGDKSSEAARLLALGFDKIFADPGRRLDERLDVLRAYAGGALTLLSDASRAAATVHPSALPESRRAEVVALLAKLEDSTQAMREFAAVSEVLSKMAGKESLRKYLLIFQNPTELRPTGGFMGSFAEITVDRGAVKSVRVPPGGTYDLKGQLTARIQPPRPLGLVAARWQFQDANWFPDFPESAKKIRWFWSKSGQSTLDGVIAVNATFVEKLLAITGPMEMPEYSKTIDASNFLLETQKAVEIEYDKTANTPKKFIGDLSTKLMERMKSLSKDEWLKVAAVVSEALETKDIQLALTNPDEEALAERYGWSGRLKEGNGDSLAIIEANVAGQKTDGVIAETVDHRVAIQADGSIIDTVKLNRAHNGKKGELFRGVRNVSYLRVYVPKGSTLISASGFDPPASSLFKAPEAATTPDPDVNATESRERQTDQGVVTAEEGTRTYFGGWLQLDPGRTQSVTLTYRLPFTAADILSRIDTTPGNSAPASGRGAYLLLLTSQSGKASRSISTSISYPSSWIAAWSRPSELQRAASSAAYTGPWDRDRAIALFFTPSHEQTENAKTSSAR